MYKLKLRKRPSEPKLVLLGSSVKQLQEMAAEEAARIIKMLVEQSMVDYEHDLDFLKQIVNWVPVGGLPLTEMAKWLKIGVRIAELDTDKEYTINLTQRHVELIWERLTNPEFKLNAVTPQFQAFILDFQVATGRHFPDEYSDEVDVEVADE